MLKTLLLIGTGGFIGSVSRYLLTKYVSLQWPASFPLGTFSINILGCLVIGVVMGFSFHSSLSTQTRLLLATGFCGGFTTFSTYSLEIFELYERGQSGLGFLYMAVSVITGLAAVWFGLWITRIITAN